jgi:hypothetical protein
MSSPTLKVEIRAVNDPDVGPAVLIQFADHFVVLPPAAAKTLAANINDVAHIAASTIGMAW